jgi:hypothetical protein
MTLSYVGAGDTPSAGPTQGILNWKSYVMDRWPGGMDLGTYAVRPVRGGTALSVHAVGRAWDWRYQNPGPGRATAEQAMAFAIERHELLGIQAIHDYVGSRIWRCSRGGQGPGWKNQRAGNGMGDPTAGWLHWEVHPQSVLHQRAVASVLGETNAATTDRPAQQSVPTLPQPTLRRGSSGSQVLLLQQLLSFLQYYQAKVDGEFGPKTETALKAWQQALQQFGAGAVDGIYGPRTRAAAEQFCSLPQEDAVA